MPELGLSENTDFGLNSLRQVQTRTSLKLHSRSPLPLGPSIVFLFIAFVIGTPVLIAGSAIILQLTGWLSTLIGSLLIIVGLVPVISASYLIVDSLLTRESYTFDKQSNQLILRQQDGFFKVQTHRYPLREILSVEVQETLRWHQEEADPVYCLAINFKSGQQIVLGSFPCYYEEIPQHIAISIQEFLNLHAYATLRQR